MSRLIIESSFVHVPLGVCSTKRRHQSPELMILSHVNCFFQVLLDSLHPRSTLYTQSGWKLQL